MGDAGKDILTKMFDDAIDANANPPTTKVCEAHEGLRLGVYALCMKARSDMETNGNGNGKALGNWIEIGKKGIILHGSQAILAGGVVYIIGKVHGWW